MFQRFDARSRQAIRLAEEYARALRHHAVRPDHLFVAAVEIDDSTVLADLGLRAGELRDRLHEQGDEPPASRRTRPPAFLPLQVRETLRAAFRASARLGSREVTPLHLVLSLVDDPPGEVTLLLDALHVTAPAVRDGILLHLIRHQAGAADNNTVVALRPGSRQREEAPREVRA